MKCIRCGQDNAPSAKFCSGCGVELTYYNAKSGQKGTGIIFVLGIILAMLIVGVVCAIVCKYMDPPNVIPNTVTTVTNVAPQTTQTQQTQQTTQTPSTPANQPTGGQISQVVTSATMNPNKGAVTQTSTADERQAKKEEFLARVDEIERYTQDYLIPATAQIEINSYSGIVCKKWDDLLNEVYQYLKTIMPESEFEQLQKEEIEWIVAKEKAIEEAAASWAGGTGEPMVRYGVATTYTEERCNYLISLIK